MESFLDCGFEWVVQGTWAVISMRLSLLREFHVGRKDLIVSKD